MLLLVVLVFLAAFAGVIACTFWALRFAGRAMARQEPRRGLMTTLAIWAALGVPACAALGFAGMAAVQFYATASR